MTGFTGNEEIDWSRRLNIGMEERLIANDTFGWKKPFCVLEPWFVAQLSIIVPATFCFETTAALRLHVNNQRIVS